jgi:hypothetical protein
MLKQAQRGHALNHFLKKPARVAPRPPMAVPWHGSLVLCEPNEELRFGSMDDAST